MTLSERCELPAGTIIRVIFDGSTPELGDVWVISGAERQGFMVLDDAATTPVLQWSEGSRVSWTHLVNGNRKAMVVPDDQVPEWVWVRLAQLKLKGLYV